MQTLYAYREQRQYKRYTTTLKDKEGKVKAIFANHLTQPRKGTKVLTVNCWKYNIDWSNCQ